jgi:hypothetical protein
MADDWAPRKLTREQAKAEQRLYWSTKTVAERLAGAAELTRWAYRLRGIDLDDFKTDLRVSRVRRSRG